MSTPYKDDSDEGRRSTDSVSSASTLSLVLERLDGTSITEKTRLTSTRGEDAHSNGQAKPVDDFDIEEADYMPRARMDRKTKNILCGLGALFVAAWTVALIVYLTSKPWATVREVHNPEATMTLKSGKQLTLDQVLGGTFRPRREAISWIEGPQGEDGLLLEKGAFGKDFLVVEDVRSGRKTNKAMSEGVNAANSRTLMQSGAFVWQGAVVSTQEAYPSRDLKTVLVASDKEKNFRHSFFAKYWLFDVQTQAAVPLDSMDPNSRIQLATFSPTSDAVVFTKDNNMYLRYLDKPIITKITTDGGPDVFYGVPDWVYEEEVFSGRSTMWWSEDGQYIAFMRTNESAVPDYEVQFFASRPSGTRPLPGLENYPETEKIKYPKAGAPNPIVHLQFFDLEKDEAFYVPIVGDFADDDRLITEVVWCGDKVLIRETNRISTLLKVVLIDMKTRTGRVVREQDVYALDKGWLEVSQDTRYIPADPKNGRPTEGYIDTIILDGYNHLAFFSPLDNPDGKPLTSGKWEVVEAPDAVDLVNNVVYFRATKESPIQRHVYSVNLNGTDFKSVTNTTEQAAYDVSFSKGASYALLTYTGPSIPWQKVISTPISGENYTDIIETNDALADTVKQYEIPLRVVSTITVDGVELQYEELRPPHFDKTKKHPVLFHVYGGPGSQLVSQNFKLDFQSYVAAALGYIVVTVDGRGTGNIGRKNRVIVKDDLGHWEAHDQIAAAKLWAKLPYVDAEKIAIWGWSYGGYLTLKTLEQDAGHTFKYGMAVAPPSTWLYYDSVYTERYMSTPQENPAGYESSAINNATAIGQNVRFLLMHGTGDDNVHIQNSYKLLNEFDLAGVDNFDMAFFPDSDHSIYFGNSQPIVYHRLSTWLVNAFNGEWLRLDNPTPKKIDKRTIEFLS